MFPIQQDVVGLWKYSYLCKQILVYTINEAGLMNQYVKIKYHVLLSFEHSFFPTFWYSGNESSIRFIFDKLRSKMIVRCCSTPSSLSENIDLKQVVRKDQKYH